MDAVRKTKQTAEQKEMENSAFQVQNLDGAFEIVPFNGMEHPGLLIDDMYDSGWTMTVLAVLLREAGTGCLPVGARKDEQSRMSIVAGPVSIDTRAILALCSRASARARNAAPLTATEYHDLTLALRERELRRLRSSRSTRPL